MSDIFSPEKRSEIMKKIRSKNTKAEILLRKELFKTGLRYRIHNKKIFGKPDIVFPKIKLAVFVDGDWWHGRNYKKEFKKYPLFWQEKIKTNMKRDRLVNKRLKKEGWYILRFWQKDVERNPKKYADEIIKEINPQRFTSRPSDRDYRG